MGEVSLELVLARLEHMQTSIDALRDEQLVQGATLLRIDATLNGALGEIRALMRQASRQDARLRKVEGALE